MIMTDDPMHVVMPRQVSFLFSFPGLNEIIYGAVGYYQAIEYLMFFFLAFLRMGELL